MPLGLKLTPPRGSQFYIEYIRKTSNDIFSWTTNGNLTILSLTGMIPGWFPIKVVQTVPVSCISRSRGQWIGFWNENFKNLLVWNYKAQDFHIWYIASPRGPLLQLFKLCPKGQNWPRPSGHNFTWNYIRKTSNDIFSWTANGNLTKLHRNDPWVVPYQSCSNRSGWLHK